MQTLTVEVKSQSALKALQKMESEESIRILSASDLDIPSLQGKPLNLSEFRSWIAYSENTTLVSVKEAKAAWEKSGSS